MNLEIGQVIEGEVSSIAFGGNGILRYEGFVIFVPFTAPKDFVRVRIVSVKRSHAFGELEKVLQPSSNRTTPRCPYFGTCGGCQLQHLEYNAQLEYKKQAIEDALFRIGQIEPIPITIVPSSLQWNYRRHITFTLRPADFGFKFGYIAIDNSTLISIEQCPIFLPGKEEVFKQLSQITEGLHSESNNEGKVVLMKDGEDFILDFRFKRKIPTDCDSILKSALSRWKHWKGISANSPEKQLSYGETSVKFTLQDLQWSCSPKAFVQNNFEQSKALYESALRIMEQSKVSSLMDLYCGIGITSILARKRGMQVIGIESSAEALKLAEHNASLNAISGIKWVHAKVENVIQKQLQNQKPDGILINPPRIGIQEEVTKALLKSPAKTLIYISCNPSTLARDVKRLRSCFKPVSATVFDMFPQTYHLETLLLLTRDYSL